MGSGRDMSYELDAWSALKAAIVASPILSGYVKTFVFYGVPFMATQEAAKPMLIVWPRNIQEKIIAASCLATQEANRG